MKLLKWLKLSKDTGIDLIGILTYASLVALFLFESKTLAMTAFICLTILAAYEFYVTNNSNKEYAEKVAKELIELKQKTLSAELLAMKATKNVDEIKTKTQETEKVVEEAKSVINKNHISTGFIHRAKREINQ